MSSNRPFFSNFLAAFRAQSAIQKAATSPTAGAAAAYSSTSSAQTPSATTRTIVNKTSSTSPGATTTAVVQTTGQFQPTRQHTVPYHRSTSPTHASKAFPIPTNRSATRRDRRGSDSSSDGFREVSGSEKWYIGGRTAAGEEKFYKLGMVKRHRSVDRLSLDRLSI
ncbi:hypothetical protein P154DRAFT_429799 [Amniculicola lignicola CBS 123094]|uniref:Uncharacterized protein n=1 Tax=Amniculicola lignicola CBS 123094 TaxID=1392246 RepID=A0A6A5WMB9_9PLEO|nr:hypothetical protein P154DRAFT_429799 [Amniculicola lignicola CBS 123094]